MTNSRRRFSNLSPFPSCSSIFYTDSVCQGRIQARGLEPMPTSNKNAIANQDSSFAEPSQKTEPATMESGLISSYDLHLFNEGNHTRLYEKFGAHLTEMNGQKGTYFCGVGAGCDAHLRHRRLQRLESRCHAHEPEGQLRRVGLLRSRPRQGRRLQVLHPLALSRILRRQGRPLRLPLRDAAEDGFDRVGHLDTSGTIRSG